ncbi:MAG: hypothetical protein WDZ54_03720 [Sneathiella sp.]
MCNPALAVAVATLAVSAYSVHDQKERQDDYIEENAKNASEAALNQYETLEDQRTQVEDKTTDELMALQQERLEKVAMAKAAAGSAGVAGISVDALMGELDQKTATARGTIENNRDNLINQIRANGKAVYQQAKGRANAGAVGSLNYAGLTRQAGDVYLRYDEYGRNKPEVAQ